MKKFQQITTPEAIGVVKFFSREENFGIVLVDGSEYKFSLDGRYATKLRFRGGSRGKHYPHPAEIYITVDDRRDIKFIPNNGDKIAIIWREGKSITWWTSIEEFEKNSSILKMVVSGEYPETVRVPEGGGTNAYFTYIPDPTKSDCNPDIIYLEEGIAFEPKMRGLFADSMAEREDKHSVLSRALNGMPEGMLEVFIIKPLMFEKDGHYLFNKTLKRYERCEPIEVHINTIKYNQQEYPADYIFLTFRGVESGQIIGQGCDGDLATTHRIFNLGVIASPMETFPVITGFMTVNDGRSLFSSLRRELVLLEGLEKFLSLRGKQLKIEQFAKGQTVQFENGSSVWLTEGEPGIPSLKMHSTFSCAIEITDDAVVVCKK